MKPRRGQSPQPVIIWLLLGGLWFFCLCVRFWGLDRFNTLVFDEVYFAKFAHHYLTQTEFFDGHPPLGKYLIAIGIWLQGYHTWGFRWMNAFIGSLIPLLVAGIAWQLTHRYRYTLLAGLCIALDGLLLVESRYALLNVYLLFFGLASHWFFLLGLQRRGLQRWLCFGAAGISTGATAAVKWNGLGFLLGLIGIWGISHLLVWALKRWGFAREALLRKPQGLSLRALGAVSPLSMVIIFGAIAGATYSLFWLPHLQQIPTYNFSAVHDQIFSYHQRVGSGPNVHPYCAPWYTWPLMLRPLSYFFQRTITLTEPVPVYGPPAPEVATRWIFDVHAMGNPPLYWAATFSLPVLAAALGRWGRYLWQRHCSHHSQKTLAPFLKLNPPHPEQWVVPLYLGVNYAANFLPWMLVSRCTFLYHYLPASMFSGLAIAWVIDHCLSQPHWPRRLGFGLLCVFALSFWFWSPIYLGLPLTQFEWQLRMFIPSWR